MFIAESLEIDHLKRQIEVKQRQYQLTSVAIGESLDPIANDANERRLERLRDEIKQIEEELGVLQTKYSLLPLSRLNEILNENLDQFQLICAAYTKILKGREQQISASDKNLSQLIDQLIKIPQGKSTIEVIDEFVIALILNEKTSRDFVVLLNRWGSSKHGDNWPAFLEAERELKNKAPEEAQPILLTVIKVQEEDSTQSENNIYYQFKSWIIDDVEEYRNTQQGIRVIEMEGDSGEGSFNQDELLKKLPSFLCTVLNQYSQDFLSDPELHICLPPELLNEAVDLWILEDGGLPRPIGHKYRVVLKCSDRLKRSYKKRRLWNQKWKLYKKLLKKSAKMSFLSGDDQDLQKLLYGLEDANDSCVGVKVEQAPTCFGEESLFSVLDYVGVPCAIWGRCNLDVDLDDELDRVLKAGCLQSLPETVRKERRESRTKADNEHIGHHLSLLWDDPEIVPPKSA